VFLDREQLTARLKQWEKFNTWEAAEPKAQASAGPEKLLNWYGAAWELARKLNPAWGEKAVNLEKIRHIQRIRAVLARLGDFDEYPRT